MDASRAYTYADLVVQFVSIIRFVELLTSGEFGIEMGYRQGGGGMAEVAGSPVWQMINAQAARAPEAVAVRGLRGLTYAELVKAACALSEDILARAPAGSVIAVDAASPVSGVIGLLAAGRSKCAVLPLNRESPPAHRARLLADAGPALILRELSDGGLVVDVAGSDELGAPRPPVMGDVAYIMYTSGSTGIPKGVLVPHTALADRLAGLATVPGLRAGETIAAMTALSFDISMAELLLPLTVGGSLICVPDEARIDPFAFADFVAEHRPDIIQATPSFWRMLMASEWRGAPGTRIWCGGEALTPNLARQLVLRCNELWNLYGPTEATIWATAARVESADAVSLGHPLRGSGVQLAAFDGSSDALGPAVTEPGQPGEIVLYGAGLALGYLGQEELTAHRFPVHDTPWGRQRCYRTGDRGQFRADGSLEFLGRQDDQIKLRGHRIELGEIEALLEEHPGVSSAVALLRDGDRPERASIIAFVAAHSGTSEQDIRGWLRARLPASHCPSRVTVRSALPRTTAGKVDRVALANA
ncbi:amino acid adenylation domain-containing protein [Streptomyces wuyuanensis]|uniref:amino acid adenylation domain-containing protein n=1 Tax=Streptomyces wuyuanensis TaxID=1196353 RepID=UPI003721DE7B